MDRDVTTRIVNVSESEVMPFIVRAITGFLSSRISRPRVDNGEIYRSEMIVNGNTDALSAQLCLKANLLA